MPVIICPKCKGQMRFPEDTPPRRVKCPVCGNVFISSEGESPLTASPSGVTTLSPGQSNVVVHGDFASASLIAGICAIERTAMMIR